MQVHYSRYGQEEDRDITPLGACSDTGGLAELANKPFDPCWYMHSHPDLVVAEIAEPIEVYKHWIDHGLAEGRQSNANFSISAYRDRHLDLHGHSYRDAFEHWVNHGQAEERDARPVRPTEAFDPVWYLNNHPDLTSMSYEVDATQHWRDHGIDEGRQSNE